MQNAEAFWDKAAEKYATSPIKNVEAYNYTLDRTRSYLKSADKVLELGCGTGSTALLLAADVGQFIASDISSNMIKIAEQKLREENVANLEFVAADLFDDALDRGPYDVVLAFNLMHLIEDRGEAIKRIGSLLKPQGLFISKTVCTPGRSAPLWLRLIRFVVPLMQLIGKAPYVKFMDVAESEALLTQRGFEIIEAGNHPTPSRYIVARKL